MYKVTNVSILPGNYMYVTIHNGTLLHSEVLGVSFNVVICKNIELSYSTYPTCLPTYLYHIYM